MSRSILIAVMASAVLVGCSGSTNPFKEPMAPPDDGGVPGGGTVSGITNLPGTVTPTKRGGIWRKEAQDNQGNGFVSAFKYNGAATDTFSVDGLAFDGVAAYSRDSQIKLGSKIRAFAGADLVLDPVTGKPIPQLQHRAIYGANADGATSFAIVRTGSYKDYGFGGFIYKRDGGYALPAPGRDGLRGQGRYEGEYAALRDFSGSGEPRLEYAKGDMVIAVDFDDFNDGKGVRGTVSNRQVFDIDGNNITSSVIAALPGSMAMPVLHLHIGPGTNDANGEMSGELTGRTLVDGVQTVVEHGAYYALLSGNGASEIVGIIAIEPRNDPRFVGVSVRETGGFVLTRE